MARNQCDARFEQVNKNNKMTQEKKIIQGYFTQETQALQTVKVQDLRRLITSRRW